jgi:hypothetical protein
MDVQARPLVEGRTIAMLQKTRVSPHHPTG